MCRKLGGNNIEGCHGAGRSPFRDIHQVEKEGRPLDVTKELSPKSRPFVGPFDQPPGMSAITNDSSSPTRTTPRLGESVVNG